MLRVGMKTPRFYGSHDLSISMAHVVKIAERFPGRTVGTEGPWVRADRGDGVVMVAAIGGPVDDRPLG